MKLWKHHLLKGLLSLSEWLKGHRLQIDEGNNVICYRFEKRLDVYTYVIFKNFLILNSYFRHFPAVLELAIIFQYWSILLIIFSTDWLFGL